MKNLRVATIRRHAAAIAAAHRESGHPTPTGHPATRELLRGMTRKLGSPPKPLDALLSEDIRRMVQAEPDALTGVRDRALILIGFAGAFRWSEIVGIDIESIRYREEGLTILVARSKTDQRREGRWVGIPYGRNPGTCPVAALRGWLDLSGICGGAVFRGLDRHGNIVSERLSPRSVGEIVKRAARLAGLDASRYSGHSVSSHATHKLLAELHASRADGSVSKLMHKVTTCDLPILDDFGLRPITAQGAGYLYEIIRC